MLTKADITRTESTRFGKRHYFHCKECGQECQTSTTFLRSRTGFCKTCIHKHVDKGKKEDYRWLFNKLVYSARQRSISVDLSFEEFLQFTEIKCCRYCNDTISWNKTAGKRVSSAVNLDRIDNTKGYTVSNVAVCCHSCNTEKGNKYTGEEFQALKDFVRLYRCLDERERLELAYTIISWKDEVAILAQTA